MAVIIDCDVVIQAGHEKALDGKTGGEGPLGKEIEWTPVVADEAVRLLKAAGVDAVKETAEIKKNGKMYRCKLALFLHFDDPDSGESGPSVGYNDPSDSDAAQEWKTLYKKFFPYNDTWLKDNATKNLANYYGFAYTATSDSEFVIEFGDLQSLRQARWMKPRLKWLGALVAHFVSARIGVGNIPEPAPFTPATGIQPLAAGAGPIGVPVPYSTPPAAAGNSNGWSKTKGLKGFTQTFSDGSVVTEATEAMTAARSDGFSGSLLGEVRMVKVGDTTTVEQRNYAYRGRKLPDAILTEQVNGLSAEGTLPADTGIATMFGKGDSQDEGTGSPLMGLVQTNSDVMGGSVRASIMAAVFGSDWRKDPQRLTAMLEVYHAKTHRRARVPLVDIGPGEHAASGAEIDLTASVDQFLGTKGKAKVQYKIIL